MSEPHVLCEGLVYGECPRWHDGKLWLSDVFGKRVVSVGADGRLTEIARVDARPSGLGFLPDGRLVIVSQTDSKLLVHDGTTLSDYAALSGVAIGPPNDMLIDANGRAYVSPFGFDLYAGEQGRTANLIAVETDGTVRELAQDLMFPNGMVLTDAGSTLVVAETGASRLTAFPIHDDGTLGERRVFADLELRSPDGICIDAEGAIWVSSFFTGEFVRVKDGGAITDTITVPGKRAVACVLGGSDGRTLFLVTADTELHRLAQGDSRAWVETARVEVPAA